MGGLGEADLRIFNGYLEKIHTHLAALAAKTPDSLD